MERAIEFNENDKIKILNLIKRVKSNITKKQKQLHGIVPSFTPFVVETTLSCVMDENLWMKGMDDRIYWGLCNNRRIQDGDFDCLGVKLGFANRVVDSHAILYKVLNSVMDRDQERKEMEKLGFSYSLYGGCSLLDGKIREGDLGEKYREVTLCRFFNPSTLKSIIWASFTFPDLTGERQSGMDSGCVSQEEPCPMEEINPMRLDMIFRKNLPKILLNMTREFVHRDFVNFYHLPNKIKNMLVDIN